MSKCVRPIRQIRLDLPSKSICIYWFVELSDSELDPWWGRFFEFLLTFGTDDLEWQISPAGSSAYCHPRLTRSQRAQIANFIRTAPQDQVATHRTLGQAVRMTQAQEERLELMYFSADITGLTPE